MAYASIRRYDGVSDVDEIIRRVEEGFVPILSGTPGFIAYYAIDQGDGTVASISVFENQAGADESNQRAAGWVKENLAALITNPPQITAGEVRISHQKS